MTKLHEVLATYSDIQAAAVKMNEEATHTFGRKPDLFLGKVTVTQHFSEEDAKLDGEEHVELTTTVPDKLKYVAPFNVRHLDAILRKEEANQRASADIEVDGKVLAKDVPAAVLLAFEHKLADLRGVYAALPTLQTGPTWEPDKDAKMSGVYRSMHPTVRYKTKKTLKPVILQPATDKHPAQVEKVTEDVPIAKVTDHITSGMTTAAVKSEMLARLDTLIAAVKKARMRANGVEIKKDLQIGHALFSYVHGDAAPI